MKHLRKAVFLVLSACFIATTSTPVFAQDGSAKGKCTFQTFNGPPASSSSPNALNDVGAVVGTILTSTHHIAGYLLYQGKLTKFMFPGSADTFPHDINRSGTIVGAYDASPGTTLHAFMAHSGGFHAITIPGFPNTPSVATGVNDNGDVAGQFIGNGANLGFLLHKGKLTILSFPGAQGGTFPTGLNNQGVIVGTYLLFPDDIPHGFMWKAGVFSNVSPLGAGHSAQVRKVSNAGDIVGDYVDDQDVGHGFSFDKGKYSTIDVPNSLGTAIFAVNSSDQVIAVAAQQQFNTNRLVKGSCSAVF
jgi:uncharacterized membrane protein